MVLEPLLPPPPCRPELHAEVTPAAAIPVPAAPAARRKLRRSSRKAPALSAMSPLVSNNDHRGETRQHLRLRGECQLGPHRLPEAAVALVRWTDRSDPPGHRK